MKKIILTQVFLFALLKGVGAQDFHLTQIDAAPHYFNAAITGMYFQEKADYRIYSDYRSQWRAFGVKPYSTFYAGYDMAFKDQFGLGGYIISNRNGKGGINSFEFMPAGSYRVTKDKSAEHQLTVGAQLGIVYNCFDPSRYTYESQFSPEAPTLFDQSVASGEVFTKESKLKPNAAMGVFYKYEKTNWKAHPFFGYSVYNLTRPNLSFTGFEKDKYPMRWVYELGADYKINDQVKIKPMILFMTEAKAHELNIGATGSYLLKDTKYTILYGLNYRAKDAFIIQFGMKYDQHAFMFSYDINTANVNNYTNGKGAFEFSLLLSGEKGKSLFRPRF